MTETALPRIRTARRKKVDNGFTVRAVLVFPLLLTAGVVKLLFPEEIAEHHRFDGDNGITTETLKPYDRLTMAEHDEIGGQWAYMARGDE